MGTESRQWDPAVLRPRGTGTCLPSTDGRGHLAGDPREPLDRTALASGAGSTRLPTATRLVSVGASPRGRQRVEGGPDPVNLGADPLLPPVSCYWPCGCTSPLTYDTSVMCCPTMTSLSRTAKETEPASLRAGFWLRRLVGTFSSHSRRQAGPGNEPPPSSPRLCADPKLPPGGGEPPPPSVVGQRRGLRARRGFPPVASPPVAVPLAGRLLR